MTEPMGSVCVRMFLDGRLIRQEIVEITDFEDLSALADQHADFLLAQAAQEQALWLVEIEILNDLTDPDRFIRFGTDEAGMVDPQVFDVDA